MGKNIIAFLTEVVIGFAVIAILLILLTGGFVIRMGPITLSLRHLKNPLIFLAVALAVRRVVNGHFFQDMYTLNLVKQRSKGLHRDRLGILLKGIVQRLALVLFSIVVCLVFLIPALEMVLRSGILDDKGVIWLPEKYKTINYNINAENQHFAEQHVYQFTDKARSVQKPEGMFRIAVLGDSFIWGDGLPYEQVWSHKLERKIAQISPQIEVMSWGWRGWSTLDEFRFLQKYGVTYDLDLLIIGFVLNDPDMKNYRKKNPIWQDSKAWYGRMLLSPLRRHFPNTFHFLTSHINSFLADYVLEGYGYKAWHDKLYSPENLQQYAELLQQLAAYCETQNIRLLFVLTPSTHEVYRKQRFDAITPILDQVQIEYLNLFPAVAEAFKDYHPRQLWANPANPHPGSMVTEVYANEVLTYLLQHKFLPLKP